MILSRIYISNIWIYVIYMYIVTFTTNTITITCSHWKLQDQTFHNHSIFYIILHLFKFKHGRLIKNNFDII